MDSGVGAGAKFMVGYVTEDGAPVNNEISTGASALFPIGAGSRQACDHPDQM